MTRAASRAPAQTPTAGERVTVSVRYGALSLLGLLSFATAAMAEAPSAEPSAARTLELQQRELELQLNLGLAGARVLEREAAPSTEADDAAVLDEAEDERQP